MTFNEIFAMYGISESYISEEIDNNFKHLGYINIPLKKEITFRRYYLSGGELKIKDFTPNRMTIYYKNFTSNEILNVVLGSQENPLTKIRIKDIDNISKKIIWQYSLPTIDIAAHLLELSQISVEKTKKAYNSALANQRAVENLLKNA